MVVVAKTRQWKASGKQAVFRGSEEMTHYFGGGGGGFGVPVVS